MNKRGCKITLDDHIGLTLPDELISLAPILDNLVWSGCLLQGTFPKDIAECTGLVKLVLDHNCLSGSIPLGLTNCLSLAVLDLSHNRLVGAIPPELGQACTALENLALQHNMLTGSIPRELGNCPGLERLLLEKNHLTGRIPGELNSCVGLTTLALAYNHLEGPIPKLSSLSALAELRLDNNRLTGSIPADLVACSALDTLFLYANRLAGALPADIGNCTNLTKLDVSGNELSGELPLSVGELKARGCAVNLHGNRKFTLSSDVHPVVDAEELVFTGLGIFGTIPEDIGYCDGLRRLNLGVNKLTGPIPVALLRWKCVEGRDVELHGNAGLELPENVGELGEDVWKIDLVNHNLRGSVPGSIVKLVNLERLYLGGAMQKPLGCPVNERGEMAYDTRKQIRAFMRAIGGGPPSPGPRSARLRGDGASTITEGTAALFTRA